MIHQFKMHGYNIVLDVSSGAVHVVDDIVYDILENIKEPLNATLPDDIFKKLSKYSSEQLKEAYSEILELYNEDYLFSKDDYERYLTTESVLPIKAICLHIAHDCNLRCGYCFASTGDFGEGRKLLDETTGKKAIDFVIKQSSGRHNIDVDFFGGEPLMNFEVVKSVVEYARSKEKEYNKNFRFTITTNGLLLNDEIMDYINREMSNVVISIDGRREVHDKLRKTTTGNGSYDIIVPKCQELIRRRKYENYYVRGTFSKYNLDFSKDVLHLNELGFDQISIEPVVSENCDYSITEDCLPQIFDEYEKLSDILINRAKEGRGFNFFHFMLDLENGPCAIKRIKGCGCGNEYVAITPDGDIYPCHQFVGMTEFKMGNLADGTLDLGIKEKFSTANIYSKKGCIDCFARFYCSGGCNANSYQYAGDILNKYDISCAMQKKRIECAIATAVAKAYNS